MSVGIKAWDESGNLILDFTDRISKVYAKGTFVINGYGETININVPGVSDSDEWAILVPNGHYVKIYNGYFSVLISQSWSKPGTITPYTVIRR